MTLTAPWIPLWAQPIPLTSVGSTEKWIKFLDPAPRQKESSTTPSNPVTRQKRSTTPLPIAHLLVQLHLSTLWTTPTKLQLSCLPTLVPSTICLKTPGKSSWRLKASQSYTTGKKIVSTKHCRLTATLPTLCQRLEERLVIWTGLGLFIPRLQVTIISLRRLTLSSSFSNQLFSWTRSLPSGLARRLYRLCNLTHSSKVSQNWDRYTFRTLRLPESRMWSKIRFTSFGFS